MYFNIFIVLKILNSLIKYFINKYLESISNTVLKVFVFKIKIFYGNTFKKNNYSHLLFYFLNHKVYYNKVIKHLLEYNIYLFYI